MSANIQIVKKVSTRVICGGLPPVPNPGETIWLYNVIGLANSIKTGESQYGPWRALLGSFVAEAPSAENPGETKRFRTGQLFLPDVALDLVAPSVAASKKSEQVQFAFRVGVMGDDSAATKYVYVAESLLAPEESDPLEMLMAKTAPQLPAPGERVNSETGEVIENEETLPPEAGTEQAKTPAKKDTAKA